MRPHMLIVDDDEAVREALAVLFESVGWTAKAYVSAEDFINNHVPVKNSCLILDLQMSGMSGADLLEYLRAEGNDVPVIVITAFPDNALGRRALAAGARALVAKPFDDEILLQEVSRALDVAKQ